jgi:hypothetical protein
MSEVSLYIMPSTLAKPSRRGQVTRRKNLHRYLSDDHHSDLNVSTSTHGLREEEIEARGNFQRRVARPLQGYLAHKKLPPPGTSRTMPVVPQGLLEIKDTHRP